MLQLHLPRFELEFGTSLKEALQALGILAPFSSADATRIAQVGGAAFCDVLSVAF